MLIQSILTFGAAMFAVLISVLAYLASAGSKVTALRDLFGRVCIQLTPDQRAAYPDPRFTEGKCLIRQGVDAVTALEFLSVSALEFSDDADRQQRVLDCIGRISPSLFPVSVLILLGFAFGLAIIVAPILALSACALVGASGLLIWEVTGAAVGGVLISLIMCGVFWTFFFKKHMSDTLYAVTTNPLWNIGPERVVADRKFIDPRNDHIYMRLMEKE